jgi:hypothetical protein
MTTLQSPHDLLNAVPFLIGYHPEESVVVVALREEKIGLAMRIDYPDIFDPLPFETMTSHLQREEADGALLVLYAPDLANQPGELGLMAKHIMERSNISVHEILIVQAGKFRSILCKDLQCCPVDGKLLPAIDDSRVAAEQVFAGKIMPFKSRTDMEGSLAPLDSDPLAKLLAKRVHEINSENLPELSLKQMRVMAAENCATVIDQFLNSVEAPDLELIARLTVDLSDLTIRDYAFGITREETRSDLWSFWIWMFRISPKGFRAPSATLLAALSYERGEAALANQALEYALADNRDYSMAKLLKRTFAAGWPAEAFEAMRRELHPRICQLIFGETEIETQVTNSKSIDGKI